MSLTAYAPGSLSGSVTSLPTVPNGVVMPNIVAPLLQQVPTAAVPQPVMMPSRSLPGLMDQGMVRAVEGAGAPAASATPTPMAAANVPPSAPPPSLTANLPEPAAVQRQKDAHLRTLDEQLRQGLERLDASIREKRELMLAQADKQKADFGMKVDSEVKMQELDLDKQFLSVVQYVKQEATRQRAMLEQQAMQLSFQYQEKKVEEDMLAQQFELHKQQAAIQETISRQPAVEPLRSLVPVPVPMPVSPQQMISANVSPTPSMVPAPLPAGVQEIREVRQNSYLPPVTAAPAGYTSSSYVPQVVGPVATYTSSSYVPQVVNSAETYMSAGTLTPTTRVIPPSVTYPTSSVTYATAAPLVRAATPITPATVISTTPLPPAKVLDVEPARVLKTVHRTATAAKTLSVSESLKKRGEPDLAAGSSINGSLSGH